MYNGSDTYQTYPGAFLTLLMKLWMMHVLYLSISDLYYKKGWMMKSQIVLLEESELRETIDIGSYKNFKVGFEFDVNPAMKGTIEDY